MRKGFSESALFEPEGDEGGKCCRYTGEEHSRQK